MRLIDADKIIQEIIQEISKCEEEIKNTQDFQREIYLRNAVHFDWYLIEYLKHKKAVEERKHGRWIKTDWGEYQCSVCKNCEETMSEEFNEDLYFNEADFMERNKFCRQCGSIMDDEVNYDN